MPVIDSSTMEMSGDGNCLPVSIVGSSFHAGSTPAGTDPPVPSPTPARHAIRAPVAIQKLSIEPQLPSTTQGWFCAVSARRHNTLRISRTNNTTLVQSRQTRIHLLAPSNLGSKFS
jgi:hypothetical protein